MPISHILTVISAYNKFLKKCQLMNRKPKREKEQLNQEKNSDIDREMTELE